MHRYDFQICDGVTVNLVALYKKGDLKIDKIVENEHLGLNLDINFPIVTIKLFYSNIEERDDDYDIIIGAKSGTGSYL
jgi:hypothetical protein